MSLSTHAARCDALDEVVWATSTLGAAAHRMGCFVAAFQARVAPLCEEGLGGRAGAHCYRLKEYARERQRHHSELHARLLGINAKASSETKAALLALTEHHKCVALHYSTAITLLSERLEAQPLVPHELLVQALLLYFG